MPLPGPDPNPPGQDRAVAGATHDAGMMLIAHNQKDIGTLVRHIPPLLSCRQGRRIDPRHMAWRLRKVQLYDGDAGEFVRTLCRKILEQNPVAFLLKVDLFATRQETGGFETRFETTQAEFRPGPEPAPEIEFLSLL